VRAPDRLAGEICARESHEDGEKGGDARDVAAWRERWAKTRETDTHLNATHPRSSSRARPWWRLMSSAPRSDEAEQRVLVPTKYFISRASHRNIANERKR